MSTLEQHRRGVPAAAPRARLQARASRPVLSAADRLSGASRREHDHQRAGDRLGQVTAGACIRAIGRTGWRRPRVRRLPANDRPGHRDPAGRSVRRPLSAPDPVSVVPAGHLPAARGRARAATAVEGGQLRGAVRAARRHRHAHRRGGRARARRRRPRRRRDHDPRTDRQTRARPAGAAAPHDRSPRCALRSKRGPAMPTPQIERVLPSPAPAPRGTAARSPETLREITTALGLRTQTTRPRTHDLRHSFAVQHPARLAAVRRPDRRADRDARPPTSGTSGPADTYWYLTATPELMGAGRRPARPTVRRTAMTPLAPRCRRTSPTG